MKLGILCCRYKGIHKIKQKEKTVILVRGCCHATLSVGLVLSNQNPREVKTTSQRVDKLRVMLSC